MSGRRRVGVNLCREGTGKHWVTLVSQWIIRDVQAHPRLTVVCYKYPKMTLEPLRSALSYGDIGETSLALPSDGASHSGQRRVMEQVTTMRKSKSKYTNRGSAGTLSPTSKRLHSSSQTPRLRTLCISLYSPLQLLIY